MNPSRRLTKTSILLLVFFLLTIAQIAAAGEKSIPETEMPTVKQSEGMLPALSVPAVLPDRNTIGCIFPMSGKFATDGNKAQDAVSFTAKIFNDKNKTAWKIIPEDSRGEPDGMKEAFAHLAKSENVMAIIAVASSLEALEAAKQAGIWKIPLILITPKEGVTTFNDYVFQHFLTPSQQIVALTKYALDDLNCAIFSILYPQDDYGMEMAKIFRTQSKNVGGKVERAVGYSKEQTDFVEEINKVTANGIRSAEKAAYGNRESKAPVSVDFEALFIPDSYQRVKMIAAQLAFYDVKGISLLGTSLWNSPNLLKRDAEYLEGAVFADSFFAGGFYPETNDFVDLYYTAYSREPGNIEALVYDTIGMVISVLEDKNIQTRRQFIAGLQQLENYKGATGATSFSEERISRKTAFILKVNEGKLEQVK